MLTVCIICTDATKTVMSPTSKTAFQPSMCTVHENEYSFSAKTELEADLSKFNNRVV